MFTGIIEATGTIKDLHATDGDWQVEVASKFLDFKDIKLGDSISVSGVCLTVTQLSIDSFTADVSNETMSCTAMTDLAKGELVNLEKAMQATSRLGGHIVSGHVDGLAELLSKNSDGRSERLVYKVPKELARYIAHKGSVCLDGVSLTVNEVMGSEFSVNIIPHTIQATTMKIYQSGRMVNLEVDVISRYLERLLQGENENSESTLTLTTLAEAGFIK